ncbi:MAG: FeoB-associated Cys-rich membrane protein [Treponema sp.]|nr:FeoB-associated Cys-rich membrane protein [Treponema sp.]
MGTLLVSIILLTIVALIVRSLIKAKRSGRHPSCGGNCGSCGHVCNASYKHVNSFLKEQKSLHKEK